ncbi:unnamed protein product, partial [Amoebophrya sp. A120]
SSGLAPLVEVEDAGHQLGGTQPRIAEVYTFGAPKITHDKNWLSDAIPENAPLPGLRVWTEQCGAAIAPGLFGEPSARGSSAGHCVEPHDLDFGAQSSFLVGDWYHPKTMDALQLALANPVHGGITGGDWGEVYEKI